MRRLHRKKVPETREFNSEVLKQEILAEAKILGIPIGAAEAIATKVTAKVAQWTEKRAAVTVDDINRQVANEIAKYNSDLSYVYKNRGKII